MEVITEPTNELLEEMIDLYLVNNDESFVPSDRSVAIRSIRLHRINKKSHIFAFKKDGILVGWILAAESNIQHAKGRSLNQLYYASNLNGISAAKLVVNAHNLIEEVAERLGIEYVISQGSHMDPGNTFIRILGKAGWETRGFLAVKKTTHFYSPAVLGRSMADTHRVSLSHRKIPNTPVMGAP